MEPISVQMYVNTFSMKIWTHKTFLAFKLHFKYLCYLKCHIPLESGENLLSQTQQQQHNGLKKNLKEHRLTLLPLGSFCLLILDILIMTKCQCCLAHIPICGYINDIAAGDPSEPCQKLPRRISDKDQIITGKSVQGQKYYLIHPLKA